MKDFFRSYRAAKIRTYALPSICALVLSLGIFSLASGDVRMGNLSANVLSGVQRTPLAGADIIFDRTGSDISIRMGKNAEAVDRITFTLLGDPAEFSGLSVENSSANIISSESGVYMVQLPLGGRSLQAWDLVTTLHATLGKSTHLTASDVSFQSGKDVYALSVQSD